MARLSKNTLFQHCKCIASLARIGAYHKNNKFYDEINLDMYAADIVQWLLFWIIIEGIEKLKYTKFDFWFLFD